MHSWKTRWRRLFRPRIVENDGLRLYLGDIAATHYSRSIYANRHEADERIVVSRNLADHDVVLELGAGMGLVTLTCCRRLGASRVHCCEANPRMEPILRRNFELNRLHPELLMTLVTLDGRPREFFVADRFIDSSQYAFQGKGKAISLASTRLADLLARIQPTFLILDVEGSEIDLLGPESDLSPVEKICVEVHPGVIGDEAISELLRSLISRGFVLRVNECRGQLLYFSRSTARTAQVA